MRSLRMCQYAGALGEAGRGFHFHVAGVAVMDVIGTGALALIFSYAFGFSLVATFVALVVLGAALHYVFCVPTALNKALGVVELDNNNTPQSTNDVPSRSHATSSSTSSTKAG